MPGKPLIMVAMEGCHAWIVKHAGLNVLVDLISGKGYWISGAWGMCLKISWSDQVWSQVLFVVRSGIIAQYFNDPYIDELLF